MRRLARRRTLLGLVMLVLLTVVGCGTSFSAGAPVTIPSPVISPTAAAASGGAGSTAAGPAGSPTPGSTSLGPGRPIPSGSVRTGAVQAAPTKAPLQPGTEHNHCRPMSTNPTQSYADPPYQFDAGGEGVPAQDTVMMTYCGPGAWVVTPYAPSDPYGLPTYTPSISRRVGIPASAVTPGKQIVMDFSEQTRGNNPYAFEMAAEFNSSARVPIDVRIMTDVKHVPAPIGRQLPGTTITGMPYKVYGESDNQLKVFTFVPEISQSEGTYDIAPYIRYAVSHGWVPGGASLDYVAYLFEVFKTDGAQPFNVNRFSVWMNLDLDHPETPSAVRALGAVLFNIDFATGR